MKRRLRTRLDLVRPHATSLVKGKQENQKKKHEHHAKDRHFKVSVPVYVKDFSSPKSWQKGTVVQATRPVAALVGPEDGRP